MYKLYRLGSISHDTDALWLSYEWGSFENREWRLCVEHFLDEIAKQDHEVTLVSAPPFTVGEDGVELVYLVDGSKATFTSDHLLSLITITTDAPHVLQGVWEAIGNRVGWAASEDA